MTHTPRPTGDTGELERTLGLRAALTIGVGTMIGAGIFVFPGIAAGHAGPAAILSFGFGALIAVLVAVCASELATAMPHSGGGYYFVSRGLGGAVGAVVGTGQWVGLMFASAFYLVGFGHYLRDLLERAGFDPGIRVLAIGAALILTAIAVTGAEKTGRLQNNLVGLLGVVFAVVLGYGVLDAVGLIGQSTGPGDFAPFGVMPVFTTAGLVFTSYLGFAQIATVAGDVQDPGRTLPRAMIGSVLIVSATYMLMIFVATSTLDSSTLGDLGETATVEVGRILLGGFGALVITGAGLLATASSANASIISASRAVYALSKDSLLPQATAGVNRRFGTPHVAILLAGIPTAVLVLTGRTEELAEVASALHLVMYGTICISLLVLRRQRPAWYAPTFRAPGSPVVPIVGALASFGLLTFMSVTALLLAAGILGGAIGWYLVRRDDLTIGEGAREESSRPAPILDAQVLVPVILPDPDPLPTPLAQLLGRLNLVVVGIREVPKQTAVEQARDEFGEEAEIELRQWLEQLEGDQGRLESRLVFSQAPTETLERVALEQGADAILLPNPVGEESIEHVLVPIRGPVNVPRIAEFVAAVASAANADVHVLHVSTDSDESVATTMEREITDRGIDTERVHSRVLESGSPADVIEEQAGRHHLVVLGESEPGDPDVLLGEIGRRVATRVDRPVLIARADHDDGP